MKSKTKLLNIVLLISVFINVLLAYSVLKNRLATNTSEPSKSDELLGGCMDVARANSIAMMELDDTLSLCNSIVLDNDLDLQENNRLDIYNNHLDSSVKLRDEAIEENTAFSQLYKTLNTEN